MNCNRKSKINIVVEGRSRGHKPLFGEEISIVLICRYAAIMAYTNTGTLQGEEESGLVKQLCQHIVGMAPTQLDDEKDAENSLLHQTFLMDEDKKVKEVLEEAGIVIVDFVRTEIGRGSD